MIREIPEEVKKAAQVLVAWSHDQNAKRSAGAGDGAFALSSLECPDGTFIVVCAPEHAYCLKGWYENHDASKEPAHATNVFGGGGGKEPSA